MMKKVLYAVMSLVIAVTVYGCRNDRKAIESRHAVCLYGESFTLEDSMLISRFLPVEFPADDSIRTMIVQSAVFDTVGILEMNKIYRFYVNGGTIVFMNPTSRNWLFFWRKMLRCHDLSSTYYSAQVEDDLESWFLELDEVEEFTGMEPMFDYRIAYSTGLRLHDYYSQTDSLNVDNMVDWICGTSTQDIIKREYNERQDNLME